MAKFWIVSACDLANCIALFGKCPVFFFQIVLDIRRGLSARDSITLQSIPWRTYQSIFLYHNLWKRTTVLSSLKHMRKKGHTSLLRALYGITQTTFAECSWKLFT